MNMRKKPDISARNRHGIPPEDATEKDSQHETRENSRILLQIRFLSVVESIEFRNLSFEHGIGNCR